MTIRKITKNDKQIYTEMAKDFYSSPAVLENIPEEGAVMFCSNHMAAKDPILIGASCPRRITFIAKKELFKIPLLGYLIKKMGAVPLDRGGSDLSAIRTSVNVLKNGEALAIFPQGHRYPGVHPGTTPTKNGAALLAYRAKCDIVPVFIKTKGFKYHFLGKVEITFGKPIPYSALGFCNGGNEEYERATSLVYREILKLGGLDSDGVNCEENGN